MSDQPQTRTPLETQTQTQTEAKQSPDEIRAEIERTRAALAETVDELSERLNVKHQAQIKADAAKAAASEKVDVAKQAASNTVAVAQPYQKQIISVAAAVGALVTLVLMLRRSRNRR
jgi:hypothetical protein